MNVVLVGLALADPGNGIQIGAATVTPEVSAGVETSTNVYRLKNQQIPAAGVLIAPRLGVESLGSTSQMRLSASISRTQWLLDFGDQSVYDIWRISRTDAGLDLDLVVMPTNLVGFVVSEQISRQNKVQPSAIPGANGRGLVTRTDSLSNLGLRVAPGPALAIDLGGQADVGTVSVGNGPDYRPPARSYRLGGGPTAQVKWNFFPRTALFINGQYEWFSWVGDHTTAGTQWRVNAAVNGRITNSLVINANLGYGRGTFATGTQVAPLAGLLAGAKVMWRPILGTHLSLGYEKGWEDSFFTDYLAWHYTYGGFDQMLSSTLSFNVQGGFRLETYQGTTATVDTLIRVNGGLVWSPSEWADVEFGGGYWKRGSAGTDFPAHITATVRW